MPKPDYDTSLARMAGNIAAGMVGSWREFHDGDAIAEQAVHLARKIVAEIKRTEPVGAAHEDRRTR